MIVVLMGSSKSDCIIEASKYLADKYLHVGHRVYIKYDGELEFWGQYVAGFMKYLRDEYVILGLDDFLFSEMTDMEVYSKALAEIGGDVINIKLCQSTEAEHNEYPVTTQMTIWNREYLIWLLEQSNSPWNFERGGSMRFNKVALLRTCMYYDCNSATSTRWEGYRLDGLKEDDISFLKNNGYVS